MNVEHDHELTGTIISGAIAVHRQLGPGLDEVAYEEALSAGLTSLHVVYHRQKPLLVTYKGAIVDCGFRLDLLVEDRLPLELKAVETIHPIHEAQLLTYMRLGNYPLGMLINFEVALVKEGLHRRVLTRPRVPSPSSAAAELRPGFDALSAELLHAALEVHRYFGPGLLRSLYEECLCHELALRRVNFERARKVPIQFEGRQLAHCAEVPLMVGGRVPVFCLSVAALTPLHEARLLARLRQSHSRYGFLLNFNAETIDQGIRRLTV